MDRHGIDPAERPLARVDLVIFALRDSSLQVLLFRHEGSPVEGLWAIPGGCVRHGEGLEEAAARTLGEETGLRDVYLEQLYTFGDPGRDPRDWVMSVSYYALVPTASMIACLADDDEPVQWWPIDALPSLAFDHAKILNYALTRLRYKLEYTAVGFELLPQEFSLTELQTAYETVLGEGLDKRNFRRKILSAAIIEPSGRYRSGEGRPARLYRYREDAVAEVKARRLFP